MLTQYERNRLLEHKDHPHVISEGESRFQPGKKLFRCSCDWAGWVSKEFLDCLHRVSESAKVES